MGNLIGKNVWITGAETPVGQAIATRFAAEGANLLLSGVVETDFELSHNNTICYEYNPVTEEHANKALALIDRLDITIVANRYVRRGSLLESPVELFDDVIDQNLSHAWCAARATAGKIGKNRGEEDATLLFISSIHGEKPSTSVPLYSVACGGINMLVKEAALDFGRLGIRVNQLRCGPLDGDPELFMSTEHPLYNDSDKKVPRGYLGKPQEIASAALFLCSDGASFINGATLTADGGFLGFYFYGDSEARWDIGFGKGD